MISILLESSYVNANDGLTNTDLDNWAVNYLIAFANWKKSNGITPYYYNLSKDDSGVEAMALDEFTSEQDNIVSVQRFAPYKLDEDGEQLECWDLILFVWRTEQEKLMFIMRWN
jgi:hypothetical protein